MKTTLSAPDANKPVSMDDSRAGKYLTFVVGKEEFGVRVLQVREIMGMQEVTAMPQAPSSVKGIINLRGKVIPVVDLRLKFGIPSVVDTNRTCIIVVQVQSSTLPLLIGIVVDEVSEVVMLTKADIEDTPDFGVDFATNYILGIAKLKGKVKILLDINEVLTTQEIHGLQAVIQ